MKAGKLAKISLLAVSVLIISGCSGNNSGVSIEVPDIPMHEALGEFEG